MPDEWIPMLEAKVPFYAGLEGETRERFHRRLKVFVWEKYWIEAGGMEITDEVRVVIAAAAVRLALHLKQSVYNRLTEIVVYPSHYKHPDKGLDDSHEAVVFGEAHAWGTVVLSWDAVVGGLANPEDGHDTATHEFAHVLDRNTGHFDGTPVLRAFGDYKPWASVLTVHFDRLRAGRKKQRRMMRNYGATNEAEFFAVATESFFERPERMFENAPDLYALLKRYYGFDPAAPPVPVAEATPAETDPPKD
jgi:Mlc titration factor MtfA (ptsG expression regulator)